MMWEMLSHKKLLLILDDIGNKEQMQFLAGDPSWFGSGSRIIITTRDQSLFSDDVRIFEAESMKPEEALRLFSMHQDSPPDDYLSLSKEAVASTGRLPLALELIGSLLWKNRDQDYWVKTIDRLKKVPHKDVQKKLMVSYEALEDEAKQIFLDIACFFIDHYKTYPMYMWEACKFDLEAGLEELIHMSLVKIVVIEEFERKYEKFWMHDQLRDMGRNIARRNRIWREEEALEVVQAEEGSEEIEMLRFIGYSTQKIELKGPLPKLRYLVSEKTKLDLKGRTFASLTWLSCVGDLRGNSSSCLRKLAVLAVDYPLDLTENWEGWSQIGARLKALDISHCYFWRKTPDLSNYTSLESLSLGQCDDLVEIDPSIGKLKCLKFLHLYYLNLSGNGLQRLPDSVGDLGSLVELRLVRTGTKVLPDTIGKLRNLRVLELNCLPIEKLPTSIVMLKRLEELYASNCRSLNAIPPTIEECTCLRVMDLRGSSIWELPPKLPSNLTDLRFSPWLITEDLIMRFPKLEPPRGFRC